MARLERPLDPEAAKEADQEIYALHAGDPRPNPLYDAEGMRLWLDPTDPAQAGLRAQWCDLYRKALAKKKETEPPDEEDSSDKDKPSPPAQPPPPSDSPITEVVTLCPVKLHWIKVQLISLPDQKTKPDWWPEDTGGPYPYEPFNAEITDGRKVSALDGAGFSEYNQIPGGSCSWKFTGFFDLIETTLNVERL